MAGLELLYLLFPFGSQFPELINGIPHSGQSFLLVAADGIQCFNDIGKSIFQRLDRDSGLH